MQALIELECPLSPVLRHWQCDFLGPRLLPGLNSGVYMTGYISLIHVNQLISHLGRVLSYFTVFTVYKS